MTKRSTSRVLRLCVITAAVFALTAPALAGGKTAAVRCTLNGSAKDDRLVGTRRADVICAGAGADTVIANGGNDVVFGGPGNDVVYPGPGADRVVAGADADLVFGFDGRRDVVLGGPGLDRGRFDRSDRRSGIEEAFPATAGRDPVVVAAGDIADCSRFGARFTAPLLDAFPYATVLALGDNAYPNGTAAEFARCYAPTWGRAKARTRPAPGNHDYGIAGATGYYGYFGASAGNPSEGWYSFDLGNWHLVSLNSNCEFIGGCQAGSAQELWLRADLAAHARACTLAFWHHPLFSSGKNGSDAQMSAVWQALYDAGADLVLVGHDHDYERFAPQTTAGVADATRGIREFVVGTGGAERSSFPRVLPNSEVRDDSAYGVLKLTLGDTSYGWQFVPEAGKTFTDSGSATCH